MCNIYNYVQLFTYVHISSRYWSVGGSAGQPRPVQDGRALSRPKPIELSEGIMRFPVAG